KYQYLREYNYNLYDYFSKYWHYVNKRWDSISVKSSLQAELMRFLDFCGIQYTQYTKYESDYDFLLDIQPAWLDIYDDSMLQQIFDEIPQDLSKTQRIKLGKEKIKALFKYDKTYPRWIQNSEWPIVNGKPLVFSHQEKIKGDDFHSFYYFYDEDTKEETVIEQFG
ncbi:MAG: hypothetical protein K2M64_04475, partial [Clostridia bacterium]|nr:hypothetical protein [Clostridia bacterium]